jgi:hypothetical protein
MTIHEIDGRCTLIREILNAVSTALDNIKEVLPEDVDEAIEQTESLLGIAFVAAQTYIAGTIGDANRIAKLSGKSKPKDLIKNFSDTIPGTSITKIQLCYEIANYFKHEWPNWLPKPKRIDGPRQVLYAVGINETITHPCQETAEILLGGTYYDFKLLLSTLTEWREKVIAACK